MLKNHSPQAPLTIRSVALLAAVAAVPTAIAFAAQAPPSDNRVTNGRLVSVRGESTDTGARIAPGEPLGISVEKADLMGRVEWAMMHGGRDITARKSIEWGEVQKDGKGNRSIRYKFDATIWDRDVNASKPRAGTSPARPVTAE
jgi:hypothetical protein